MRAPLRLHLWHVFILLPRLRLCGDAFRSALRFFPTQFGTRVFVLLASGKFHDSCSVSWWLLVFFLFPVTFFFSVQSSTSGPNFPALVIVRCVLCGLVAIVAGSMGLFFIDMLCSGAGANIWDIFCWDHWSCHPPM